MGSGGPGPDGLPMGRAELPALQNIRDDENMDHSKLESEQSAPGSLHDSADDESDLSEAVDDEGEPILMFPGLMGTNPTESKNDGTEMHAVNGPTKTTDEGAGNEDV